MWYGAGALWNSISIPTPRLMSPATVRAPCVTTCSVDHEQRHPEQDEREARPRDRQHREAEERRQERDAAERARQHDAGMEDLEAEPGDARRGRAA